MLMSNYFQCRSQRGKPGTNKSEWLQLDKGTPKGSYMGPKCMLFNNAIVHPKSIVKLLGIQLV